MSDTWTDTNTSPPSNTTSSSAPPPAPLYPLTQYQNRLITTYLLHNNYVTNFMNTVVDLEINIARERDEPSVQYLKDELSKAQVSLVQQRELRRGKEREIRLEMDRLSRVVGKEEAAAKRQLEGIAEYMGSDKALGLFR
jgi:hypothetical protein